MPLFISSIHFDDQLRRKTSPVVENSFGIHIRLTKGCEGAVQKRYREDIREDQLESLVLHAFLDLIGERKQRGRMGLTATMETIANWLSERTTLPIEPKHVQSLTLTLRDAHIIDVGGGGIGRPNFYDTREQEMGIDAFWDQVDALLMVWRLPNRMQLLEIDE